MAPLTAMAAATVAFTTPANYASRLSHILTTNGYNPLWCPTITVEATPQTKASLNAQLSPPNLENFSAIAFTSRAGITAMMDAIDGFDQSLLSPEGQVFTLAAIGKDAELIDDEFVGKVCCNGKRVRKLVPLTATPDGLVEALGDGYGRRVLCPVPCVVGLTEPPVVPRFLSGLRGSGWECVRVNAYETRWGGKECVRELVRRSEEGGLDAVVFTSIGEVEGLLKGLREFGLEWGVIRERCSGLVVAAHGPVTAAGAEKLGVDIDVVSSRFHSFEGVVDALNTRVRV